jgi:ferredoxin, 2Fe-2S
MPRITYKAHTGATRTLDLQTGMSVMEGAVKNAVPGIDADCGGACACATCHVFVEDEWLGKLEPQSDMEKSMLDFADGVRPNSRLACQIKVSPELDGLSVETPASQH